MSIKDVCVRFSTAGLVGAAGLFGNETKEKRVMKIHGFESIIGEHPFFVGMNPDEIELLSGCAKNVVFQPGETIFELGGEANSFYLIRQGVAVVQIAPQDRDPIIIQTLGEGRVLGWSWLFPPYRSNFDVVAQTQVRAVSLDGKCLREKCEKDTRLGYDLMKRFCGIIVQRLEASRLQLLDMYDSGNE